MPQPSVPPHVPPSPHVAPAEVTEPIGSFSAATGHATQIQPAAPEITPPSFSPPTLSAATPKAVPLESFSTPHTQSNVLGQPMSVGITPPAPAPASPRQLRVQTQDGTVREFEITAPEAPPDPELEADPTTDPNGDPDADPDAATPEPELTIPADPQLTPNPLDVVEINADHQDYDQVRQIVTATGNVIVRFARGVLTGDRVRVNLTNRVAVGDGNIAMRRGQQVFRGDNFEYQLVQDEGVIYNARGEIYQTTSARDWDISRETAVGLPERPLSDRLVQQQPIQDVVPVEGYEFTVGGLSGITSGSASGAIGAIPGVTGNVDRFRFEADRVDFDSQGWEATNIRITNDPFSPPELEIRAEKADFNRLSPLVDELLLTNSRIFFDQKFSLPTFQRRLVFDRRQEDQRPGLFNIGIDDGDRGGLFIERSFTLVETQKVRWTVTPQYLVQRAVFDEGFADPDSFGVKSQLTARFDPRTSLVGSAALTSLDLDKVETELRASVRLQRLIGWIEKPHSLTAEYSYRDRLFNGSLGFQTVQSSLGLVLTSPTYVLGDSGVTVRYQGGLQTINADSDRADLLAPVRRNNRITLTRYQAATFLGRGLTLWQGNTLPPTPEEGLRYTNRPVQPFVSLSTGLSAVSSFYSSGDRQQSISGSVSLQGQFGHFSRPWLDYTGFNLGYGQTVFDNQSPFLFDRIADSKTLSFGITQQIYGPFRIGIQSAINLDTNQEISTNYSLEYSRRTYNISVQFNPVVGLGAFQIKIGDFNWSGYGEPFGGSGVRSVNQGITNP